jgi:ketosteroid isomerase-like protein
MNDELRQEIEAVDDRRYQAMRERDWDALADVFSDDLLYTHGSGLTDDKTGFISKFKEKYRLKSAERRDVTVRGYGDVAVMHGRVTMEMDVEGVPKNMNNNFVAVWAKRRGLWKLVHFQPTPIAK